MTKNILLLLLVSLLITACSIKQEITPVPGPLETDEICIIRNPAVYKEGFLEAMQQALKDRGYTPRVLSREAKELSDCKYNINYTANWRWDLALYMSYAKIDVINNNTVVGTALYDANMGGGNFSKFINGTKKVRELVDQLIPTLNGYREPVKEKKNASNEDQN